jgi:hypothetical protein
VKKLCFLSQCAAAGPDVIVTDQLVLVVGHVVGEGGMMVLISMQYLQRDLSSKKLQA